MRDHADVPSRKQLRTRNYPAEARAALGKAVEDARVAAGFRFRTDFCRAHGIKSYRSLEMLEQGDPGVGQAFLFEVADALPGWTRDTPRIVLEGGEPPSTTAPSSEGEFPPDWSTEDEEGYQAVYPTLYPMLLTQGLELTRGSWRRMRRDASKWRAMEQITESIRSNEDSDHPPGRGTPK